MDPSRKWPVLLAFGLLTACGVAAVARDWQWAFMGAAGMMLVLALVVGTDITKMGLTAGKEGGTLSIERTTREMELAAGELATVTVQGTRAEVETKAMPGETGRAYPSPTETTIGTDHTGSATTGIDLQRRKQVERLMAAAAKWGWVQAKSGAFSAPPTPVVEWHGDKPEILMGVVTREYAPPPKVVG